MAVPGVALLLLALGAGPADTLSFATPATRALMERAMARHRAQESAVTDYRAQARFRVSFALGRRAWSRPPTMAVEEIDATVHWQAPNDMRVDLLGRRARARHDDMDLRTFFDRPWFFPRQVGDSVRLFGGDFPERAAVHPLAAAGPAHYRYAITDSQRVRLPDGGAIRLQRVEVRPRTVAPALVAGYLWLDQDSGEVVRFTFRFVGEELWETPEGDTPRDSADARKANQFVNRILEIEADLEYGLQEGRYWMPYRQAVSGRVRVPFVGDLVVPFTAETRFDDYVINGTEPIVFTLEPEPADSAPPDRATRRRERREARSDTLRAIDVAGHWGGGQYQIHRPPQDSLAAYGGWGDSLQLDETAGDEARAREAADDLARLAETLPPELTGRHGLVLGVERLADVIRYNRVSGLSLGMGLTTDLPGVPFASAWGSARYGIADGRLGLRAALMRDAPDGRWTLAGYGEVQPVEQPPAPAVGPLANTVNAMLTGHDNGEYLHATGGSLRREQPVGLNAELMAQLRVEGHRDVRTSATNFLNDLFGGDGAFPANPDVRSGTYLGVDAGLTGVMGSASWTLGLDALGDDAVQVGRLFGRWRQPLGPRKRLQVELQGGLSVGDTDSIPQRLYRLGGLTTVRGLEYGTARGPAYWALRTDWTAARGRAARVMVFADMGQAAELDAFGDTRLHAGAGVGLSFLGGLARIDLSHPLTSNDGELRVDLVFGSIR